MKHLLTLLLAFTLLNGYAQVPVMSPIVGPSVLCSSTPISQSYSTSATNSPLYYTWSYISSTSSDTLSSSSSVATALFYDINQTYTVFCTATNGNGTSLPESFVVNVFETPNVNFSGSNTFCQGSSTSISASSTLYSASSTVSYNWAPSTGLNTTVGSNVIANPSSATNYTVTAVNGVCSSTAQITVTPFEMLPITFSGANTFCQGSSTNLSASSTISSASSTVFYSWSPSYGLNTTNGSYVTANPAVSTNYTVTAYYQSCFSTGQITVGPNGFSPPTISAYATNTILCYGDSTALNASGANTYTWSNGAQNGINFMPYNTDTYYVSGTDMNGCVGSSSVNVTVNQLAYFSVNSSSNPLPSGQTATLTIYGNAGTSYSLNTTSTSTTIVVSPTVTTTYTFASVNSSGCVYTLTYTQYVGIVMGVESINNKPENYFSVFPNPNNGEFNIKSSTKETVRIINELGEIVRVIDIDPEKESHVSDLSSGIYMILSGKSKTKIIVTH